jgi:hypothetical protein
MNFWGKEILMAILRVTEMRVPEIEADHAPVAQRNFFGKRPETAD